MKNNNLEEKIEEVLKKLDKKFFHNSTIHPTAQIELRSFIYESFCQFAQEITEEILVEEKEIYAPEEVGHSLTHAIATNQHYGWNACLEAIKANRDRLLKL